MLVYTNDIDNSLNGKTRDAIALMPTGNMDGSWYYYTLSNGGIVRRLRAKSLPMTDDVISRLNFMANADSGIAKGIIKRGRYTEFVSRWTSEQNEYESMVDVRTPSEDLGVPEGISAAERIRVINPAAIGTDTYTGGINEELEAAAPEGPKILPYDTVAA